MKLARRWLRRLTVLGFLAQAGTWSDSFSDKVLGADWQGDTNSFWIVDSALKGVSAFPVAKTK